MALLGHRTKLMFNTYFLKSLQPFFRDCMLAYNNLPYKFVDLDHSLVFSLQKFFILEKIINTIIRCDTDAYFYNCFFFKT